MRWKELLVLPAPHRWAFRPSDEFAENSRSHTATRCAREPILVNTSQGIEDVALA